MDLHHQRRGCPKAGRLPSRHGFTLIEICIVLLILGLLLGVLAPGIQSAFTEQTLRNDARELSLMVKTAMLRTAEEHRTYTLDLTDTSLTLTPLGEVSKDSDKTTATASSVPSSDASTDDAIAPESTTETWHLNAQNQLLLPNSKAGRDWLPIHSAQWVFRPGELCPATAVCFVRGEARLQMSFNPLTGNVEDEKSFIP